MPMLPVLIFAALGLLFGWATYPRRHLFSEGHARQRRGDDDPLDSRTVWVALCSLLWPLMVLSGLFGAWRRARVAARPRVGDRPPR